jgi:hypothetical protein
MGRFVEAGKSLDGTSLDEMEGLWQEAARIES